jgi:predicted HicB family RNase H-like nuclease
MSSEMTPDEEYEFYADPANQEPTGKPRRRTAKLTTPIPVRFPADVLDEVKKRAEADDRSVSSWIRRAVEHEINRTA